MLCLHPSVMPKVPAAALVVSHELFFIRSQHMGVHVHVHIQYVGMGGASACMCVCACAWGHVSMHGGV